MALTTVGGIGLATLVFALAPLTASAQDPAAALAQKRVQVRKEAMGKCARGIIDPTVKSYMAKTNAAGGKTLDEAQARAELESRPQWKANFIPKIERACACAFGSLFKSVDAAKSEAEINQHVADFTAMTEDPNKFGQMIAHCNAEEQKRATGEAAK